MNSVLGSLRIAACTIILAGACNAGTVLLWHSIATVYDSTGYLHDGYKESPYSFQEKMALYDESAALGADIDMGVIKGFVEGHGYGAGGRLEAIAFERFWFPATPDLPAGSPVQFRLSYNLHADILTGPLSPADSCRVESGSVGTAGFFVDSNQIAGLPGLFLSTCTGGDFLSESAVLTWQTANTELANPLYLNFRLALGARAQTATYDVLVDARSTSRATVEMLTAGATYRTASGYDYGPASVPEPASMGIVGASLGSLSLAAGYSRLRASRLRRAKS